MEFCTEPPVFVVVPTLCVGAVEARGLDNSVAERPEVDALLAGGKAKTTR